MLERVKHEERVAADRSVR